MAESDSSLPASLWAIPAPLVVVATVALLAVFGLQRAPKEAGDRQATASPPATTAARASDAAAPVRSPAMELLRRYLNEVRGEDSAKAPEFEFSSRLSLPDRSRAELTVRFSSPTETSAAGVPAGESEEEKRFRELKEELTKLRNDHPFTMRCLVATVPDPIDSHLQLMFDAELAAVTRACEQHGYVLDRYELPWSRELRERPVTGRPDVRKYRHPGAVLFRKSRDHVETDEGETCDLLMLLLVGEIPTGGVRKSSLCSALDFVAAWDQTSHGSLESHRLSVKLLGPSFSGSSPSLRWSVFDWRKNRHLACHTDVEVAIVSGSATAESNRALLTSRADPLGNARSDWPPLTMEFHSTVIPDRVAQRHLIEHLAKRGIDKGEIALLVEGNTSYGQSMTRGDKQSDLKAGEKTGFAGVLELPFPMALSRIRSEYEQSQAERADFAGELPRATRSNLKLPLDPPPYATDVLPTFATGVSAVTDLSLEQILGTISRRGIRAVGIVGTDVRDKLFLAQRVRRYAPNVQLFMIESDLLYTHADYAPYLSGTLIACTYPLFTQNQHWTGSLQRELLFPADTAEGVYNAAILLLNRLHPTSEPRPLLDYSYPFAKRARLGGRPPLWLTMAGESGLWPVQAIRLDQSGDSEVLAGIEGSTQTGKARFRLDPPSSIPALVATLLSLVLVAVFWAVNWCPRALTEHSAPLAAQDSKRLARIRASCRWLALPGSQLRGSTTAIATSEEPTARDTATPLHLLTVGCFFAALLAQQVLLGSPVIVFVHAAFARNAAGGCWLELLVSFVSLAATAILLWVVLGLTFRMLLAVGSVGPHSHVKAWRIFSGKTWILLATAVGAVVWYLLQSSGSMSAVERTQAAIFVERIGTLSSGVTWLVPAVLLAAILGSWAACQLWRLHFLEIYPLTDPVSPRGGDDADAHNTGQPEGMHTAGISERFRELDGRLRSAWFLPTEIVDWLFLVLLALGLIHVFVMNWIGTAEGGTFDFLFRGAAGMAIMLIGWSLIHVKSVGGLFERLLRRMAQHALVTAFDRVPDRLAAKAAGQIFAASPHPGDFEQPVRCLTQLAETHPELWLDATKEAQEVQHQFARLLACSRSEKEDADRRAAELNCLLAGIAARQLAPRLEQYWNKKGVVRGQDQEPEGKRDATAPSWEVRAEVFLAMHFVNLIRQVFAHIKSQLTFLILMLLCLLAAFHAYPFQPSGLITQLCYGLTLWCLVTTVLLIIRFNRCEVLSRLSNTTPNRFTFDRTLVLPMITFVVIPLCSLLAVQFPGIGRMLFGWLEALRNSMPG
jgi:hypothetical protein